MKRIFSLLTIVFLTSQAMAQNKLDEIITKVLDAQGGKEKLLKINSVSMKGFIEFSGQKIPLNYYAVDNKAQRIEFTFSGLTGYFIVTKDSGFNFNPFQGQSAAENMTAEDVKLNQNELDLQGVLVNYKNKGYTVELLETEDVDGVEAIQLKVNILPNKTQYYFVDPSNYYVIRTKTISVSNGQQNRSTTDYYNFKKTAEGVLFPFISESSNFGNITYETIELNKTLDEKLFKPTR